MRIDVLTIFPGKFKGVLEESILRIAREKGLAEIRLHDFREYSTDKHKKVDDRPYGGGPGMVLACDPVFRAVESVRDEEEKPGRLILLTPQGTPFTQKKARELSEEKRLVLLCGNYEGFDERIRTGLEPEEISIGDYILTGGEIPAMVLIDAVVRLIPGVLGDEQSPVSESFTESTLEGPQYTRPPVYRGMEVPEILRSGHHAEVEKWRWEQALKRTRERRPDLLQ